MEWELSGGGIKSENIEARMKELFTLVGKKRWWNNVL